MFHLRNNGPQYCGTFDPIWTFYVVLAHMGKDYNKYPYMYYFLHTCSTWLTGYDVVRGLVPSIIGRRAGFGLPSGRSMSLETYYRTVRRVRRRQGGCHHHGVS